NYSDYKDFAGVKFPVKIKQTIGDYPALDLTVTDVQMNAAVNIAIPGPILQASAPYARVASQMVADGVWHLTGGTHHSVVLEMKDHLMWVRSPMNEAPAGAVRGEAKTLSRKPINYVVATHHHSDHAGGLRAVAAEPLTILAPESNRAFLEKSLAAPSTVNPDRLAKSGKKATVEGGGGLPTLAHGAPTVHIHQAADNNHHAATIMIPLPNEKLP